VRRRCFTPICDQEELVRMNCEPTGPACPFPPIRQTQPLDVVGLYTPPPPRPPPNHLLLFRVRRNDARNDCVGHRGTSIIMYRAAASPCLVAPGNEKWHRDLEFAAIGNDAAAVRPKYRTRPMPGSGHRSRFLLWRTMPERLEGARMRQTAQIVGIGRILRPRPLSARDRSVRVFSFVSRFLLHDRKYVLFCRDKRRRHATVR
jgi:hypothetical protein